MKKLNDFFDAKKDNGILFLRLVAGWRLIAGTWAYAIHSKPMTEVESFFQSLHLPAPMVSAYAAVYAEIICGVLFIIGLWVRPAAIIMILTFTVAILAAHLKDQIITSFQAWALLAMALCFLFTGAGKISIDERINKKKSIWER